MKLMDKDKRHKYMEQHLRMKIAYQIKLLRLQREITQNQLADLVAVNLKDIAKAEDWDAPFPALEVLTKIAHAFDCALSVRFDGWDEVVETLVPEWVEQIAQDA